LEKALIKNWQNQQQFHATIIPLLLDFATLGDATQVDVILSVAFNKVTMASRNGKMASQNTLAYWTQPSVVKKMKCCEYSP
jgi:hypothetical protein